MCGVGNWKCPYKDPYDYYVKLNNKNEIVESNFDGNFKNIEGFIIEKRKYQGCPRFNTQTPKMKDEFLDLNKDEFLD
jgi:hypothetical protein